MGIFRSKPTSGGDRTGWKIHAADVTGPAVTVRIAADTPAEQDAFGRETSTTPTMEAKLQLERTRLAYLESQASTVSEIAEARQKLHELLAEQERLTARIASMNAEIESSLDAGSNPVDLGDEKEAAERQLGRCGRAIEFQKTIVARLVGRVRAGILPALRSKIREQAIESQTDYEEQLGRAAGAIAAVVVPLIAARNAAHVWGRFAVGDSEEILNGLAKWEG